MIAIVAVLVGCSGGSDQESDGPRHPNAGRTLSDYDELPPPPDMPEARRGRLVTRTTGDFEINGTWESSAGICPEIGIVEIYAGPSGMSTGILLRLPEENPIGTYPVVAADPDFPDPPVAMIAVQAFKEPDAFGFQAYFGELELTELDERVSGNFVTTAREITIDMLSHYVGVFEDIPLEALPDEYCETVRDSTLQLEVVEQADTSSGEG